MDPELAERLSVIERKVEETQRVAQSARRLFIWTIVVSLAFFIIPLIAIAIALPSFLRTFKVDSLIGSF